MQVIKVAMIWLNMYVCIEMHLYIIAFFDNDDDNFSNNFAWFLYLNRCMFTKHTDWVFTALILKCSSDFDANCDRDFYMMVNTVQFCLHTRQLKSL